MDILHLMPTTINNQFMHRSSRVLYTSKTHAKQLLRQYSSNIDSLITSSFKSSAHVFDYTCSAQNEGWSLYAIESMVFATERKRTMHLFEQIFHTDREEKHGATEICIWLEKIAIFPHGFCFCLIVVRSLVVQMRAMVSLFSPFSVLHTNVHMFRD